MLLFKPKSRFQLWEVMKDPAMNGAVVNREATFLHQFIDAPVTEGVGQRPTNALQDHVLLNMSAFEACGCHDGFPSNSFRVTRQAMCDRTVFCCDNHDLIHIICLLSTNRLLNSPFVFSICEREKLGTFDTTSICT